MSWDKGFDFRSTSGFVTDPTNCTYVLAADSYPTTRNSVTFGWLGGVNGIDRNAGVDARLAGVHAAASLQQFQVDLPATGDYAISVAFGDESSSQNGTLTIKDNSSAVLTIGPHTLTSGTFYDAADANYSDAAWPGSETPVTKTFATQTLIMEVDTVAANWVLAHLFVSQASAPPPPPSGSPPLFRNLGGG